MLAGRLDWLADRERPRCASEARRMGPKQPVSGGHGKWGVMYEGRPDPAIVKAGGRWRSGRTLARCRGRATAKTSPHQDEERNRQLRRPHQAD
jgi:hypothetical protein